MIFFDLLDHLLETTNHDFLIFFLILLVDQQLIHFHVHGSFKIAHLIFDGTLHDDHIVLDLFLHFFLHSIHSTLSTFFYSLGKSRKVVKIEIFWILNRCLHDQCNKLILFPKEIFSLKNFKVKLSSLFVYRSFSLRHDLLINRTDLCNQQV